MSAERNAPLLRVENLCMRFGGLTAIDDLSVDVAAGQITAVIGPNGAGKTTFFNCLTGFYKPTSGRVRLNHPQHGELALAGGEVFGAHVVTVQLFVHVPYLETQDGQAINGHAERFGIDAVGRGCRKQGREQRDKAGVHALHAVVAFLVEFVNAVFAVGNDIGSHVTAAGHILDMPQLEVAQVLGTDKGAQ